MAGNRILYFYLTLLSLLFFILFDQYLFHLFFLFLLILPLLSLAAAIPIALKLRLHMEAQDDIMPKGNCGVNLIAQNACFLPCVCVRVHLLRQNCLGRVGARYAESSEEVVQFSLGGKRTFTLHPLVKMAYCGRVDLTIHRVEISDMLGLFCLPVPKKNLRKTKCSIYVLPELQSRSIETDEAADLGLDSATYSAVKAGGDPSEIFQLREYRPGDSYHSIHRALSNRMERLIVREFGLPLNPSLHFLLELREDATPAEAEFMLGTALAFSEYLMSRETNHCISWLNEDGMLHTAVVTGADTLAAALHELLCLPGQKRWSALLQFAVQERRQADTHLVYLVAGRLYKKSEDAEADTLLTSLPDMDVCRRVTILSDRFSRADAAHIASLGCEVQRMDGLWDAETEETV